MTARWTEIAATDLGAQATDLLSRYDEAARRYHTREHLSESFAALSWLFGEVRPTPLDQRIARLALWFHDAVYDPRAPGNEAASADLAVHALTGSGLTRDEVGRVAALVRATATHDVDDHDLAGGCLMDADLWILSAPAERYRRYVRDVRAEYAHLPEADFQEGRAAVLEHLSERPYLFCTGPARRDWEPRARAQIAEELAGLRR